MNDNSDLTTYEKPQPPPIVLKLKKFDDTGLVHHPSTRPSVDPVDGNTSASGNVSLLVRIKKSYLNGDHSDDDHTNNSSTDSVRPQVKRSKKSSLSPCDNMSTFSSAICDELSSNQKIRDVEKRKATEITPLSEMKPEHCMIAEQSPASPLVIRLRRYSETPIENSNSYLHNETTLTSDQNRTQLLLKLKKNEYGELTSEHSHQSPTTLQHSTTDANNMSLSQFILTSSKDTTDNISSSTTTAINRHPLKSTDDDKVIPTSSLPISSIQSIIQPMNNEPLITNVLANFCATNGPSSSSITNSQWTTMNSNNPTTSNISPIDTVSSLSSSTSHAEISKSCSSKDKSETHTRELLDEALDSVKNVLMQTFKKNLETGSELSALKNTLGSDEVAEAFLAKLRQSLKRELEQEHEHRVESNQESAIPNSPPLLTTTATPPTPTSPVVVTKIAKRKSSTPSTNPNRFDGTTEEELTKRILSDILEPNLDIVFVGINPSLYAVHKGHHYGGPGNHFWKLLYMSGLIPNAFNANDDQRMPQYGIGFTNIVQRPTKAASDVTKDEIQLGAELLLQKIKLYKPKIVAFNGRGIYEVYAGNKHFHYGKQPELFPDTETHVFVMPSSSARCSQLPRAEDKLPFYAALKKLKEFVNGQRTELNEGEITFPDIKIKDTDDVLQKTIIRISNKPFSELSADALKSYGDKIPTQQLATAYSVKSEPLIHSPTSLLGNNELTTQTMSILNNNHGNYNNNNLLRSDPPLPPSPLSFTSLPSSDNQSRFYPQNPRASPPNQLFNIPQTPILVTSKNQQQLQNPSTNLNISNGLPKQNNVAVNKQMNDLVIKVPLSTPSSTIIPNGQEQQNIYSVPNSSVPSQIVFQQPPNTYTVQHHPQTVYVGQYSQQQLSHQPTPQFLYSSPSTINLGSVNNSNGIRPIMTNTQSIMPHHQTLTIGQTVSVPSSVTLNSSNEYQQRNSLITNSIHSIVQNSNNTSYSQIISRQIMNSNEPTPSDSGITTSSASPPLQRCHTPIRPQPCSSASSISSQSSTFSSSSSNSSHVDIQYQSSHINVQSQIQTNKVRPLRSIAEQQQQPTTYYNGIVSQANSTTTIIGHPQLPPPPFTSKMPASANQQQAIAPKAPPAPISTPIVTTTSTVTTGSQQRLIAPITPSSQTDKSIPSTRPPLISLPPFIIPLATSDDCYFVRYDRDVNSYDGMKFSYLIDDLTSYNKHKRTIRYVSLNDL